MVFNDVFDSELDQVERPERPIPSGLISKSGATIWASVLLLGGVLCALLVNTTPSGILAIAIATDAVVAPAGIIGEENDDVGLVGRESLAGCDAQDGDDAQDSFHGLASSMTTDSILPVNLFGTT